MPLPQLPITILETGGRNPRPIVLFGAGLPREGNETLFGVRQRTKVTYYPGNSEATGQVLGAQHEPITFSGMLEDRRNGIPGSALALVMLMQAVAKSGRVCLFNYGPFFRRVLWKRFEFQPTELQRINYEVELEVLSDGLGDKKRVRAGTQATPNINDPIARAGEVELALEELPPEVGKDALANTKGSMRKVLELSIEVDGKLQAVGDPGEIVNASKAQEALQTLDDARRTLRSAEESSRGLRWDTTSGSTFFEQLTGPGAQILDVRSGIANTGLELNRVIDAVRPLAGEPTASSVVYVAADGDTLQRLSERFYDTPDRWVEIFMANDLASPSLVGGEQLRIPDVPALDPQVPAT